MTSGSSVRTVVDAVAPTAARRRGAESEQYARKGTALDTMGRRVFWELRHARLRLAIAENDIAWAQDLLVGGGIAPEAALVMLEEIIEDVAGVRP